MSKKKRWKPSKVQMGVIKSMRETGQPLRVDRTFTGGARLRGYSKRVLVSTAHALIKNGVVEKVPGERRVWYEQEYRLTNDWLGGNQEQENQAIKLYVDGSCRGNPGVGGWAAVLVYGENEKVLVGGADDTTANRMELTAVIEGLKAIKANNKSILVVTDSAYVRGMMGRYRAKKNLDLVNELRGLMRGRKIHVKQVRGHSGHEMNDRADELATAESARRANEESGRN
jgi:ribonuclease HI